MKGWIVAQAAVEAARMTTLMQGQKEVKFVEAASTD